MNKIIRANLQHLNDLASLCRTSFLQAYGEQSVSKDMSLYLQNAFNKKELANQLMSPATVFFILKIDNEWAGYYKLRWDKKHPHFQNEKSILLERIYLLQKFTKKGFGKKLLNHSISHARDKGFEWIWLGVWTENSIAFEFYKKNGFEKFGEETFQFGTQTDTDWLMKKRLMTKS